MGTKITFFLKFLLSLPEKFVKNMLKNHFYEGKIEAGCDEAGRGCLAGSVFAAAVILPNNYQNDMLNDSKQLTEKKRYQLRNAISFVSR